MKFGKTMALISICLALMLIASAIVTACSQPAPSPAPAPAPSPAPAPTPAPAPKPPAVTLKFASWSPPGGTKEKAYQWFLDELAKRSEGGITIEPYWGESLLKSKEMLMGVAKGTTDMGYIQTAYHPTELFAWSVAAPVLFASKDPRDAWMAKRILFDKIPQLKDEFDKMNQRIVIFDFYGETKMWSATKPLNTVAGMNGEKIRVSADYAGAITAVGAVPISMTSTETYEALQKGAVEGCILALDAAVKYHFQDVCKYGADMWHISAGATPLVTINNDTFNKLPKQYQDLVMTVGEEAAQLFNKLYIEEMASNWAALEKGGLQRVAFTDAEIEKWRDMPAVQALKEEWIKKADAKGYPGKSMLDAYLASVAEAQKITKSPPLP